MENTDLKTTDRRRDLALYLIAGLALLMRWVHLAFVAKSDLVRVPIIDAAFYHDWANSIAHGELIGKGVFFMSPLYPYLLGFIYAIFGAQPIWALIVQGLLGALTVMLLFKWTERLAGRSAAIVTGVLAALYTPFIFYDSTLLTSSLIMLLSAAILYFADLTLEKPSAFKFIILGALIGLSALARPLVLIFVPFLWLILFLKERKSSAKRLGLALIGTVIILAPVSLRNLFAGGEFTLTTSSAGMNFYVGNNADATGLYWEAPFLSSVEPQYENEDYRRVASEAEGRELTTREAGDYWSRRAFDWMLNDPLAYLKLLGRKIFYFWNRAEFANNVSIFLGESLSPVLHFDPVGFWFIAPLGLAGLLLFWRHKSRERAWLLWAWVAAYFLGGLIFFVSSEYRLPAILPLLAGCGYFLTELYERLRDKRYDPALRAVALGLILMPLVSFRTGFIVKGENPRMDWFNIANTLLKNGAPEAAAERFRKSLAVDPYFPEAMLRLAEAEYRSGHIDKAIEVGKQAGLPDSLTILNLVKGNALQEAYALLGEGKLDEAAKEFGYAGYDPNAAAAETTRVALLNRAKSAYESGDLEQSLAHFRAVAERDTAQDPAVFYNIAFIYWQMGHNDSAEVFANKAIQVDSLNVPAGFLLVRIYNATGRHEEADLLSRRLNPDTEERERMLKAVRIEMDSLEVQGKWEPAMDAYGRYGKLAFDTAPEDKLRLGRLQYHVGNYDLALRLLSEADAAMVSDPSLFLYEGLSLQALGRMDEALAAFQRAAGADPKMVEARLALARFFMARRQVEAAWKELDAVGNVKISDAKLAGQYNALLDSVKAKL